MLRSALEQPLVSRCTLMWSPWKALWKKQDLQMQFREEESEWGQFLTATVSNQDPKLSQQDLDLQADFQRN